ncbi:hypothetical protein HDU76_003922 [Blyttiomyces sp. JEL0837]|nr:hypothetical protein HDU76_003922 [Blyttiomyces sp. JEL0837]
MAFRSPHYWASILSILIINGIDLAVVVYNTWLFKREKNKVGAEDIIDIDDGYHITDVEIIKTGYHGEIEYQLDLASTHKAQPSPIDRESALTRSVVPVQKNPLSVPGTQDRISQARRPSSVVTTLSHMEATKQKVELHIIKVVSATKAIQNKLNQIQIDIESRSVPTDYKRDSDLVSF